MADFVTKYCLCPSSEQLQMLSGNYRARNPCEQMTGKELLQTPCGPQFPNLNYFHLFCSYPLWNLHSNQFWSHSTTVIHRPTNPSAKLTSIYSTFGKVKKTSSLIAALIVISLSITVQDMPAGLNCLCCHYNRLQRFDCTFLSLSFFFFLLNKTPSIEICLLGCLFAC